MLIPFGPPGGHVTPAVALADIIEARTGRRPSYPGSEDWMAPLLVAHALEQWSTLDDPPSIWEGDHDLPAWFIVELQRRGRGDHKRHAQRNLSSADRFRAVAARLLERLRENADEAEADYFDIMELRPELLDLLAAGAVRAWGVPGGAPEGAHAQRIPEAAFAAPVELLPDRLRCTVTGDDAPPLWRSLLVSRSDVERAFGLKSAEEPAPTTSPAGATQEADTPQGNPAPKPHRRRAQRGYAAQDEPLVQEMHAMIRDGRARNPWGAALAVAPKAAGSDHGDSKAKRLLKLYSELFSAEQNGED